MKQTAVEFLEEQLKVIIPINQFNDLLIKNAIHEAKEMEKQQIIDAYKISTSQFANEAEIVNPKSAKQYYNETFKK